MKGMIICSNKTKGKIIQSYLKKIVFKYYKYLRDITSYYRIVTTVTMTGSGDDSDGLRQSMQEIVDKFMQDERQHP